MFLYYTRGPPVNNKNRLLFCLDKQQPLAVPSNHNKTPPVVETIGGANLRRGLGPHQETRNGLSGFSPLRVTPAMAAGVTDHLWTIEELLNAGASS